MKVGNNELSVGYNNEFGQSFFDLLHDYTDYIHSYFFSVGETFFNQRMNINHEIYKFKSINTYGINGNLIFNNNLQMYFSNSLFIDIIDKLSHIINLTDVTVSFPHLGKMIKKYFPHLIIHSSVRYFAWSWDSLNISTYPKMLEEWVGIADIINLDSIRSLTDYDLQKRCRELGFGIKYITGEGCISMNEDNYNTLPGFENASCHTASGCKHVCSDIYRKYPWMELARIRIYKEMLDTIDYDIIKLATRSQRNLSYVKDMLDYYTTDGPTDHINNIKISDGKYEIFMQYINDRLHCSNKCGHCMKCEKYYQEMLQI